MRRSTTTPSSGAVLRQAIEDPAVQAYYERLGQVPGWFATLDFVTLVAIDQYQYSSEVVGDLLEIGAYAGKSAILLGFLRKGAEHLVVCDIFDGSPPPAHDQAENAKWYGAGVPRSVFERWYRTFHQELPDIIERPSTDLAEMAFERPFRLIHIDGSHVYETVRSDLAFARDRAGPGAIVVLDDFGRPHAPGDAAAAREAVLNSRLRPLLLTHGKLYAAWDAQAGLAEYIRGWAGDVGVRAEPYSVPNGELLFLHQDPPRPRRVERLTSLLVPPAIPALARRARQALAHRQIVRRSPSPVAPPTRR